MHLTETAVRNFAIYFILNFTLLQPLKERPRPSVPRWYGEAIGILIPTLPIANQFILLRRAKRKMKLSTLLLL